MRREAHGGQESRRLSLGGVARAAGSWPVGVALFALATAAVLTIGLDHRLTTPGVDLATRLGELDPLRAWRSPYPDFIYPPLSAYLMLPIAHASALSAVWTLALVACVPLSLWWFGVRDWRCYLVALLWPPVAQAISTGNVTLLLVLGTAAAWRWRASIAGSGCATGLAIATKVIAWPLVVWLVATRRAGAAAVAVVGAGVLSLALWAPLRFGGLLEYPGTLRRLDRRFAADGYSVENALSHLGFGSGLAAGGAILVACVLVAAVWLAGRRGADEHAFTVSLVAMVFATPIVWLHSFALLLGCVAVLKPRLALAWLLPLLLYFGVESGNGFASERQLYFTIGLVAATVGLACTRGVVARKAASGTTQE